MRKNYQITNKLSELKMTQAELAKKAHISSEARLSRIIHYLINPSDEEANRIASVLEIDLKKISQGISDEV